MKTLYIAFTNIRKRNILITFFFLLSFFFTIQMIIQKDAQLVFDKLQGKILEFSENMIQTPFYYSKETPKTFYMPVYGNDTSQSYNHMGNFLLYTAETSTKVSVLAEESLKYTSFFSAKKLETAIILYNRLNNYLLNPGDTVYIPFSLGPMIPDMSKKEKPPIIFSRALYYTGSTIAQEATLERLLKYKAVGINTIVFDAKDVSGIITYNSQVPEVQKLRTDKNKSIDDIAKLVRLLKDNNFYVVARIACFRDELLAKVKPEWSIKSASGSVWKSKGEIWCDPTNKEVQDYNISLACELADKGIDEIQFDYIRFPTTGNQGDARFTYSFGKVSRENTITNFLIRAEDELHKRNTNVSIDIFGVVAWGHEKDITSTGQRIELLASHCDVISPMLYPSHFNDNFDGYKRPGDNPYYFINTGCLKIKSLAGKAVVRPWLQAFGWRVTNYNSDYITQQVKGSLDSSATGYLFWNAANSYDTVYRALAALPENMK